MRNPPNRKPLAPFVALASTLALVASLASAQQRTVRAPAEARGGHGATTAVSVFAGPPSGEVFQLVTGYGRGTVYTNTRGGAQVTPDAILLQTNGVYRIHLEGVVFVDSDTGGGDPAGAVLFSIALGGEEAVSCITQPLGAASRLPAVLQPTPDHDSLASCTVDFTLEVRDASTGDGWAFPRSTPLQAGITPNDLPLGSALALVRFEVTRVGV